MSYNESIRLLVNRLQFMIIDEAKCKSPWLLTPLRDLTEHERIGHTCAKHIGLSLQDLRQRVIAESLFEASCFWSIDAAKASVCFLTLNNLSKIIRWLQDTESRVVLEGSVPTISSIGYIVTKNSVTQSNRTRMVLRRLSSREVFGIVTAFPIR